MLRSARESRMMVWLLAVLSADPEALAASCIEGQDPSACRDGGLAFAYGDGVERDDTRAGTLFFVGCDLGDEQACFHAKLLDAPDGALEIEANEAGLATLKARCSASKPSACYQLGVFHDRGPMGYRDMSQAMILLRHACEDGEPGEPAGDGRRRDLHSRGDEYVARAGHADVTVGRPVR